MDPFKPFARYPPPRETACASCGDFIGYPGLCRPCGAELRHAARVARGRCPEPTELPECDGELPF